MKQSNIQYATMVLSEIFGEQVNLVRDHDRDAYIITFQPGYFTDQAENAVDKAFEINRE